MMVHPRPYEQPEMPITAVNHLQVAYTGKEAHASAYLGTWASTPPTPWSSPRRRSWPAPPAPAPQRPGPDVTKGGDAANVIPPTPPAPGWSGPPPWSSWRRSRPR